MRSYFPLERPLTVRRAIGIARLALRALGMGSLFVFALRSGGCDAFPIFASVEPPIPTVAVQLT
jgi:hypothetical protein